MDTLILIAIATGCFLALRKSKATAGMNDKESSLDNIHRGVANGWYTCKLTRVNSKPAVILTGKDANGDDYSDLYPVSEKTWQTLKAEGYETQ